MKLTIVDGGFTMNNNCLGMYYVRMDSKSTNWHVNIPMMVYDRNEYVLNLCYNEGKSTCNDTLELINQFNQIMKRFKIINSEMDYTQFENNFLNGSFVLPNNRIHNKKGAVDTDP